MKSQKRKRGIGSQALKIPSLAVGMLFLAMGGSFALPIPLLQPPAKQVLVKTTAELVAAVAGAVKGRAIVLSDGVYDLSQVEPLRLRTDSIWIIGESRNPEKVILKGQGFGTSNVNEELVKVEASNITLAHVTLRDVRANGLKVQTGGNHGLLVHNVHFIDICERSIKGPDVPVSRGGIVQFCLFEQKTPITSAIPNLNYSGDYIAGMDMMKIEDWSIRDNVFKNIRGMNGGGRAAVFLWNGCKNVTVERNVFIGCDRAISLGNTSSTNIDMDGGLVRNNFIVAGVGISLEICNSTATQLVHNTIYSTNPSFNRTVFSYNNGTGNVLRNNLILGRISVQNGKAPDTSANLWISSTSSASGWFRNPGEGDLHLNATALPAIDKGLTPAPAVKDIDDQPRDNIPDLGADEFGAGTGVKLKSKGKTGYSLPSSLFQGIGDVEGLPPARYSAKGAEIHDVAFIQAGFKKSP